MTCSYAKVARVNGKAHLPYKTQRSDSSHLSRGFAQPFKCLPSPRASLSTILEAKSFPTDGSSVLTFVAGALTCGSLILVVQPSWSFILVADHPGRISWLFMLVSPHVRYSWSLILVARLDRPSWSLLLVAHPGCSFWFGATLPRRFPGGTGKECGRTAEAEAATDRNERQTAPSEKE